MSGITSEEAFAEFRSAFPSGVRYRDYSAEDDARLSGRIPAIIRTILEADGWCSYADASLWLCDPDEWQTAARAWFPGSPSARVLARSALGDIFVVDDRFWIALVHKATIIESSDDPTFFFAVTMTDKGFTTTFDVKPKMRATRTKAGQLAWDEMYTYEPALALGGKAKTAKVLRVKAREQLDVLSQLAAIETMRLGDAFRQR